MDWYANQPSKSLSPADRAGLSYVVNDEVEQEFGASASWLSAVLYDEGLDLNGGDSVMPAGRNLSSIPAYLAVNLVPESIKLNHNVTNIAYSSGTGVTVRPRGSFCNHALPQLMGRLYLHKHTSP